MKKISRALIYLFFLFLPFGRLLALPVNFLGGKAFFYPIDIIPFLSFFVLLLKKVKIPKPFLYFSVVLVFSFFVGGSRLGFNGAFLGGLYLVRLISYLSFALVAASYLTTTPLKKEALKVFLISAFWTAIFGWIQYFFWPDFRPFFEYGWDDHLYRMVGTFFDPAFLSFIFVPGALTSFSLFLKNKKKSFLFLFALFSLSLLFTYARGSYLAFLVGLAFVLRKNLKTFFSIAAFFILFLLFLPRPAGEGVRLERVSSVVAKEISFSEGVSFFQDAPLFGVGYNNICLAKGISKGKTGRVKNSCSGFETSLITLLAATGIVGLVAFLDFAYSLLKGVSRNYLGELFWAVGLSFFVHGLFVNSLFYTPILGIILVFYAVSRG